MCCCSTEHLPTCCSSAKQSHTCRVQRHFRGPSKLVMRARVLLSFNFLSAKDKVEVRRHKTGCLPRRNAASNQTVTAASPPPGPAVNSLLLMLPGHRPAGTKALTLQTAACPHCASATNHSCCNRCKLTVGSSASLQLTVPAGLLRRVLLLNRAFTDMLFECKAISHVSSSETLPRAQQNSDAREGFAVLLVCKGQG